MNLTLPFSFRFLFYGKFMRFCSRKLLKEKNPDGKISKKTLMNDNEKVIQWKMKINYIQYCV